jgi:hypothetical protein
VYHSLNFTFHSWAVLPYWLIYNPHNCRTLDIPASLQLHSEERYNQQLSKFPIPTSDRNTLNNSREGSVDYLRCGSAGMLVLASLSWTSTGVVNCNPCSTCLSIRAPYSNQKQLKLYRPFFCQDTPCHNLVPHVCGQSLYFKICLVITLWIGLYPQGCGTAYLDVRQDGGGQDTAPRLLRLTSGWGWGTFFCWHFFPITGWSKPGQICYKIFWDTHSRLVPTSSASTVFYIAGSWYRYDPVTQPLTP